MVGSPEYKLAKFLNMVIKPNILDKHISYKILEKLQQNNLNLNEVMTSFDVKSIFTNVFLQEAIDFILNKSYDNNSNSDQP